MIDTATFSTILDFACKDLASLNSVEKFQEFLSKMTSNVKVTKSSNFMDIPTENTSEEKQNGMHFTKTYGIEYFIGSKWIGRPAVKMKALYMDTINGPYIAFDLLNEEVTDEMVDSALGMGRLIHNGNGYFKHKYASNFVKITFMPDFNKYVALVASNQDDLDHPIYSWNKVIDYVVNE